MAESKSICSKLGLKPLTRDNLVSHYMPATGCVSFSGLAIVVMNPSLKTRLLDSADLTNFLLWNTVVGTGCYVYSRKHLAHLPTSKKMTYGAIGGLLFSFGSVLIFAFLKNVLPKNNGVATFAGLSTGLLLIRLSTDYLSEVDSVASKN